MSHIRCSLQKSDLNMAASEIKKKSGEELVIIHDVLIKYGFIFGQVPGNDNTVNPHWVN